jgi:cellulose synthase/poly-beta-1,6-N-acetylglucosamine synthase-like glycosyltransferase
MQTARLLAEVSLWTCLGLVAFVYVGYPLTLLLLRRRPLRTRPDHPLPPTTVVIAAHNEAASIAATVRDKLEQEYPAELLDVVVVSDGSVDGTDDEVRAINSPRVTLLRQEPRQGKTLALNRALEVARGDIIVFSDANSLYQADAVRELARMFSDATVGYVTGRLEYQDPGTTAVGAGSGMYMRYENWLRRLENRVGSIVGVNGGIDAVRRALYAPMRADHLPDFILPLRVAAAGHRIAYCDAAVCREEALGEQRDEYRMRVRVSLRALHALAEMRSLISPRYGRFGFEVLVHKILRYLVVLPLAGAFVSNALLLSTGSRTYIALFGCQAACYLLAAIGWASRGRIRFVPVFAPFYFCLVNVAAGAALVRFLRGERQVLWTPRRGA